MEREAGGLAQPARLEVVLLDRLSVARIAAATRSCKYAEKGPARCHPRRS
jgi:hypothetical protein